MKFRVHLISGKSFETEETPQEIQKKYMGRITKIKKVRGEPTTTQPSSQSLS